ncbi:MAG: 5'/3'-nucleotidase SurE [Chitinispirillales bacterium]|jgi:5'-nucleotidase|nr:5'/3'-nucleotidase SurE [Chitinispirillales bacterium]
MRKTILISNDDGYLSNGIEALISAFKENYDVFVVAPQAEQSGKSHSFTFGTSITYKKIERKDDIACFSVNGSPADCVKVALAHLMPKKPDFVISGINTGENIGIATFYSGTCAAAREAGFWRIPAVAFSLHCQQRENISGYGKLAFEIFEKFLSNGFLDNTGRVIYNVNFPHLPINEIKGVKIVRQSLAYYKDTYIIDGGEAGGEIRLRANGDSMALTETDCEVFDIAANFAGYSTITPVLLDTTDEEVLEELKRVW